MRLLCLLPEKEYLCPDFILDGCMNNKLSPIIQKLKPYSSIIYFLLLLFFFHFMWKWIVDGDMTDRYIYIFDKNVTPDWFFTACKWLTASAAWFVRLFPNTENLVVGDDYLMFPEVFRMNIIWGCTGIKQMSIFACIMIFYRCMTIKKFNYSQGVFNLSVRFNPYWNKLWYIPLGCIILTLYNIIRVGSISLLTRDHPERFDEYHDGIFRYIYYTIIFLLWVFWEEVYVKRKVKSGRVIADKINN